MSGLRCYDLFNDTDSAVQLSITDVLNTEWDRTVDSPDTKCERNDYMDNTVFCQSCGMPMATDEMRGSETDGSLSQDYCTYCYQKGEFQGAQTLVEMIDVCVPFMVEGDLDMTPEKARQQLTVFLPTLKPLATRRQQ